MLSVFGYNIHYATFAHDNPRWALGTGILALITVIMTIAWLMSWLQLRHLERRVRRAGTSVGQLFS